MSANPELKSFQVLGGAEARWGGGSAVVLAVTQRLVEEGCQVWVLCLSQLAARRFAEVGANIVTSRHWRRPITPLLDLLVFWELFRLCRREKFDIVHTHTSKGGFLGRVAARLAGVPLIVHTAHGYVFNETDSKVAAMFYTYLEKLATHFCDLIISVNDEERLIAIDKKVAGPDKIVTVLNGINPNKFENVIPPDSLRRELNPSGEAILIGTTGRLMPQKGFVYLIRAMPTILKAYPSARVVVVGDGPLETELKSLAGELGITDRCRFLGFRENIPELLTCFDIFVLPSLWEGLSISLLEAMAARKPVVATNIKGTREVIANGVDGLLVNPADPIALAEAVISLMGNKARAQALGEKAGHKISTFFREEIMIEQILALYHKGMIRNLRHTTPFENLESQS